MSAPKAVILLSGGLDSATCLVMAQAQGFECYALSLRYQQRHNIELEYARRFAKKYGAVHREVLVDLSALGGSALTDEHINVPEERGEGIPITYVPARNTMLLTLAAAWAEVLDAQAIFIGVNAVDYSGYPDCRAEFIQQYQELLKVGTKAGVEGHAPIIYAPLLHLTKAEIIKTGVQLGVDYSETLSCYQPDVQGKACGRCDSCYFRKQGFEQANVLDPTIYQ